MAISADAMFGSIVSSTGFTVASGAAANTIAGVGILPGARSPQRTLVFVANPGSWTALTVRAEVYRGATWVRQSSFSVPTSQAVTQTIDDWPSTKAGSTRLAILNASASNSGESLSGWIEVWRVR